LFVREKLDSAASRRKAAMTAIGTLAPDVYGAMDGGKRVGPDVVRALFFDWQLAGEVAPSRGWPGTRKPDPLQTCTLTVASWTTTTGVSPQALIVWKHQGMRINNVQCSVCFTSG
jgi:hypothetical protein